jgi:hypothetical protein
MPCCSIMEQKHLSYILMLPCVETKALRVHVHSIVTGFAGISSGPKRTPKQRLLSWQFWKKNKTKSNQAASKAEQGRKQRLWSHWSRRIYVLDDPRLDLLQPGRPACRLAMMTAPVWIAFSSFLIPPDRVPNAIKVRTVLLLANRLFHKQQHDAY